MNIKTVEHDDALKVAQTARQAAQIMSDGGVVVFPTETVYGVGAAVESDRGMNALRALKGRTDSQPFSVHIPNAEAVERYIDLSSPILRRLIDKVFPGPITLIVDVPEQVIEDKVREMGLGCGPDVTRSRLYHNNTIGLRCPDHPVAQQILANVSSPVVASSANHRGDPPPHNAADAAESIGDQVQIVVDGGETQFDKPSTIVQVTNEGGFGSFKLIRAGVYEKQYMQKLLQWNILMVCSGNTCRSPMAEGVCKKLLADERGIKVEDLEEAGINVMSAGAYTVGGSPASGEAVEAMGKFDIDISNHRSQPLTNELINEVDVIYCMTKSHLQAVVELSPASVGKVYLIDPNGDIDDPIGSSITVYQRCAEVIRRRLTKRLKEQMP